MKISQTYWEYFDHLGLFENLFSEKFVNIQTPISVLVLRNPIEINNLCSQWKFSDWFFQLSELKFNVLSILNTQFRELV